MTNEHLAQRAALTDAEMLDAWGANASPPVAAWMCRAMRPIADAQLKKALALGEAERQRLSTELSDMFQRNLDERGRHEAENKRLQEKGKELIKLLLKYGDHTIDCAATPTYESELEPGGECDCGLTGILAQAKREEKPRNLSS